MIESCGVPHPEVDLILVSGQPVDFHYTLGTDADIELYPAGARFTEFKEQRLQATTVSRFVADGHLGKLVA